MTVSPVYRLLLPAGLVCLVVAARTAAGATPPATANRAIPFPAALEAANISVPRIDDVHEHALLIGNGDINTLVVSKGSKIFLRLTKNDVWDARLDTANDPPLPTLARLKELANTNWPNRKWILPEGSKWKGPDSYHAHAYPCPRACAQVFVGPKKGPGLICPNGPEGASQKLNVVPFWAQATLDLRRAVVGVAGTSDGIPKADIRALADRNVFFIETPEPVELLPILSKDLPPATTGADDGVDWLHQAIPGDLDWPGMSFAVALAGGGGQKAIAVVTSRESNDPTADAVKLARRTAGTDRSELVAGHERVWDGFWSASGIDTGVALFRDAWYRNLYFLRCTTKRGVIAPGLFAGLITDTPAWHGDYHLNINLQQTFWGTYVTNHPDMAEPYDRLITEYLPRARWIARQVFDCGGAYFPHVLFAYEPPHPEQCRSRNGRQYIHHVWAFTIGVSGFTVQPLWWHYKYAPNREYLETTAYPAVRDVGVFYADFIDKCDPAPGGKVVLAPSVSPEHWGWTPMFLRNRNCAFDIGMIRFTLEAAIEGATTLGRDGELVERFKKTLSRLPDYPTSGGKEPVVVDVLGAGPITYNLPVPAFVVFPCGQVTRQSPTAERELFIRTVARLRRHPAFAPELLGIARARLGMSDAYQWFYNEVAPRMRANGTMLGVPRDRSHPFNFFGPANQQFGGMTAAISELLVQSAGDVIRVLPAWPKDKPVGFRNLRAQGGFLVSAVQAGGKIEELSIAATVGGKLRLQSPWPTIVARDAETGQETSLKPDQQGIVELDTRPDQRIRFQPQ